MRFFIFSGVTAMATALAVAACGDFSPTTGGRSGTPTPTPTVTATVTAPTNTGTSEFTSTYRAMFITYCGCHEYSTLSAVKTNRQKILTRINANTMPPRANQTSTWTNTDKSRLVNYLTNSSEIR